MTPQQEFLFGVLPLLAAILVFGGILAGLLILFSPGPNVSEQMQRRKAERIRREQDRQALDGFH